MNYPIVDRHYSEDPQPCPDCPNEHNSLYTIGDSPIGRCFLCTCLAWHRIRASWLRCDREDNTPARLTSEI